MNAQEMIQRNNEWRDQLTAENEEYYKDLADYVRYSRLTEKQAEEVLLEMLDHLLQAQKKGKTAKEVFGTNPKEWVDEVIKNLNPSPWKPHIEIFLLFFLGTLAFISFVNGFERVVFNQNGSNYWMGQLSDLLFYPFLSVVYAEVIFYLRRKINFTGERRKKYKNQMILLVIMYIVVGSLYKYFTKGIETNFHINPWIIMWFGISLSLIIISALTFYMKKDRGDSEEA